MVDANGRRLIVLLALLALTVGAIFYPVDEAPQPHSPRNRVQAALAPRLVPAVVATIVRSDKVDVDPFAPRGWKAVAELAPAAVVIAATAPAIAPPPSGPPTLPFQFVGQMVDGGSQVVYLSHGDQTLLVRSGEVLEGTYKVAEMTARKIQFIHLPSGETQSITFPALEQ